VKVDAVDRADVTVFFQKPLRIGKSFRKPATRSSVL